MVKNTLMRQQRPAVISFKIEPLPFNFSFLPMLIIPPTLLKINRCLSAFNIQPVSGRYDVTTCDWELVTSLNEFKHTIKLNDGVVKQIVPDEAIIIKVAQISIQIYQLWIQQQYQIFVDRNTTDDNDRTDAPHADH